MDTPEIKENVMTKERIEQLEKELETLKIVRRKEIADKIKVARSYGDLSENSEYDEAKNEQAILESKIAQLEKALTNVKVLDEDEITTDHVGLYSTVKVEDLGTKDTETYTIVGATETDFNAGKISDESPVGKALLGHVAGETVDVYAPAGTIAYKIIAIKRPELG